MTVYDKHFISSLSKKIGKSTDKDFLNFLENVYPHKKNNVKNNSHYNHNNRNKNKNNNDNKPKEILVKSSTAWDPSKNKNNGIKKDSSKKIKGILNKITNDNFDKLILKLKKELKETKLEGEDLDNISKLMLKKICYDKKFHELYIKICDVIWNIYPIFKKILLNKCQKEFMNIDIYIQEYDNEEDDEEQDKINRKIMGTIEFISYMFNLKYISTSIIKQCIFNLARFECDKHIEGFKTLVEIINIKKFDEKLIEYLKEKISNILNADDKNLQARIKYILEDLQKKI